MNTAGLIPDSEEYITTLKESFQTMSQPILLQYTSNILDSFIKNYLEINIDSNEREFLLNAIYSYYTTHSGSIFMQSEFTKCFTNPEEIISAEFQELFSQYQLPYPSFKKDYPECRYKTKGEHSSSYFIKSGMCKTKINNEAECKKKQFKWIKNKPKFSKIFKTMVKKSETIKPVDKLFFFY